MIAALVWVYFVYFFVLAAVFGGVLVVVWTVAGSGWSINFDVKGADNA
jgi:hypothetical protein